MRRRLGIALLMVLLSTVIQPAQAATNTTDPSLPVITGFSAEIPSLTKRDSLGQLTSVVTLNVKMSVDVKYNSLSTIQFIFSDEYSKSDLNGTLCANFNNAVFGAGLWGSTDPVMPAMKELVSTTKSVSRAGWRNETYQFIFPMKPVTFAELPCIANIKVRKIFMQDQVHHSKTIMNIWEKGAIFYMDPSFQNGVNPGIEEFGCPMANSFAQSVAGKYSRQPCKESDDISKYVTGTGLVDVYSRAIKAISPPTIPAPLALKLGQVELNMIGNQVKIGFNNYNASNIKLQYSAIPAQIEKETDPNKILELKKLHLALQTKFNDILTSNDVLQKSISELAISRKGVFVEIQKGSNASPSPSLTKKPNTSNQLGKMGTILCQSGKTVKKIMGLNPTCPKGYTPTK